MFALLSVALLSCAGAALTVLSLARPTLGIVEDLASRLALLVASLIGLFYTVLHAVIARLLPQTRQQNKRREHKHGILLFATISLRLGLVSSLMAVIFTSIQAGRTRIANLSSILYLALSAGTLYLPPPPGWKLDRMLTRSF